MNEKTISRAAEIIKANTAHGTGQPTACVLCQIDMDGAPTAATITPSKSEGIAWITFDSGLESNWAKRARRDNRACVCFSTTEYNISLVGTLEIVTDPQVKQEMWYEGMGNHFTGPDDANYCVLRFVTQRYNLLVDWQEARGGV